MLLNIGPSPEGTWPSDAYDRLRKIGAWMNVNGEAIYGTRTIAPYKDGKVYLTKKKNSETVYAIYLASEEEENPPTKIWLNTIKPIDGADVSALGRSGTLKWEEVGTGFCVDIPKDFSDNPPCKYAWVVKISEIKNKL